VARRQLDLRERRDDRRDFDVVAVLEHDRERLVETRERLVGLPEQELESAEVVEQLADVRAVAQLFVLRLRALRIRAREHPMAVALRDQRGLEVRLAECACVVQRLRELERALDVLARGLIVALAAIAPRAPGEDVRAKQIGRKLRALDQRKRLAEEPDGSRDAREQVPADAEPEEDLRAVEIRELLAFDEPARLRQQLDR